MSNKLNLFYRLQAGPFVQWLQDGRWLSAPAQPALHELTATSLRAAYLFDNRQMLNGQVIADGVLATVANDMATLLVEAGAPAGARWAKRSLQIDFIAAPLTGELLIRSAGAPIDWAQAGGQLVTIEGHNGNDMPVFSATLKVVITPAA